MKRPFISLSLALTLGIVLSYLIVIDINFFIFLGIIFILLYILLEDKNSNIYILFLVFLLGIFLFSINDFLANKDYKSFLDKDFYIRGYIEDIDKVDDENIRYIFKMEVPKKEKILLTTSSDVGRYKIGDKLEFNSSLKIPEKNTNPKLFNYNLYLRSKNIKFKTFIDKVNYLGIKENIFIRLKRNISDRIDSSLSQLSLRNRNFLESMLLGKSNIMDEEDIENFRQLGLSHILAVSGLHLGIITGFLIIFLSILTIDRKTINIISIIFILFYIFLIGYTPSILRAGLAMIIYLLSINIRRYSDSINNLFFISFILAIINPFTVFNLGFQLSFIATLSVLLLSKYIRRIYPFANNPINNSLLGILGVQIGLFPVQIYYFNYFNFLSIIGNLIIVPIISLVLPFAFILIILNGKLSLLSYSVSRIINILLDLTFKIMDFLQGFNIFEFKLASPSILVIVFYYFFLALIFKKIRIDFLPRDISRFLVFFLIILISFNIILSFNNDYLVIDFIDVDQGDSTLISYKNKNYLIDTGGNTFKKFDIGKNIVIPYLIKSGVLSLDIVFISHFDDDHCKSLVDIMDEIKMKKLVFGYEGDNNLYKEIVAKSHDKNIPIYFLNSGDIFKVDEKLNFKVYGPDKPVGNQNISDNNLSLVLEVNYYDKSILFTGDIEEYAEDKLLEKDIGRVDFLKVAHHGSKTSSKKELLERLRPSVGFIQVGRNNPYSHPNREVLERYEEIKTKIYRTDQSGLIKLVMNEKNYGIDKFIRGKYSIIEVIEKFRFDIITVLLYFIIIYLSIKVYLGNEELDNFELYGVI